MYIACTSTGRVQIGQYREKKKTKKHYYILPGSMKLHHVHHTDIMETDGLVERGIFLTRTAR